MRWCCLLFTLFLGSGLGAGEPIRVAVDKSLLSLNPLLLAREVEAQVVDLVFDRLVAVDERGVFVPQLLESWEISPSGRDILLKLRPGLRWQDGSPLEAEDLVATWRLLSLPQVRKVYDLVGVRTLDSLVAEGPLHLRIRLKEPRASLLSDLHDFQPVPRRLYTLGVNPLQHPLNFSPIGSGPYRVLPGATGQEIRLERWAGYAGPHPGRWEGFLFRLQAADPGEHARQFLAHTYHAGELDWFHHYLLRRGAFGDGTLVAQSAPQGAYDVYWFNCNPRRSLLGDVRLRRALSEALPWEFLMTQRHLRIARLASSLWPPGSWASEARVETIPSADRARLLLEDAGWAPGPDGVCRDAQGRPLKLVMYCRREFGQRDSAQAFRDAARKFGIQIELRRSSFDDIQVKSSKGEGDIWDYAWSTSLDPDSESPLFTTEGIKGGTNVTGYQNPEVDALFEQGRHELDPQRRQAVYRQINSLIQRDHPLLQLTYVVSYLALDHRLRGVGFSALGQTYGFVPGRRGWWLAE